MIEITTVQKNDIIKKSYSGKYSFEEIRDNKYFLQFNSLDVIFDELKDRMYNNQLIIKENRNNIYKNIPLPKNKEWVFELTPFIKINNERLNELTKLIIKLKAEMDNITISVLVLIGNFNNYISMIRATQILELPLFENWISLIWAFFLNFIYFFNIWKF